MVERYHLVLLAWSVAAGCGIAALDGALKVGAPTSRRHPLGTDALLLAAVSALGVWMGVPDTEPAIVCLGLLVPVGIVRAATRRPIGPIGWLVVCSGVVVAAALGSAAHPGPVAASCAIGAVLVAPAVGGFRARRLAVAGRWSIWVAQVVLAVLIVRLTVRTPPGVAWSLGLAGLGVVGLVVALAVRSADRTEQLADSVSG